MIGPLGTVGAANISLGHLKQPQTWGSGSTVWEVTSAASIARVMNVVFMMMMMMVIELGKLTLMILDPQGCPTFIPSSSQVNFLALQPKCTRAGAGFHNGRKFRCRLLGEYGLQLHCTAKVGSSNSTSFDRTLAIPHVFLGAATSKFQQRQCNPLRTGVWPALGLGLADLYCIDQLYEMIEIQAHPGLILGHKINQSLMTSLNMDGLTCFP
jgi:hypothetical protein